MAATHFNGPVHSEKGFVGGATSVTTLTGATTITREDHSGKLLVLNAAGGAALTLPAVATSAGCKFKFIVGAAFATTDWVITSAEGDNIEGALMVASTVVDVDAADTITFDASASAENIGDWVSLECDGTYWYADGRMLTTAATTAEG
jgi:hypothetical protein